MIDLELHPQSHYDTALQLQQTLADEFKSVLNLREYNHAWGLFRADDLVKLTGNPINRQIGTIYGAILFENIESVDDSGLIALPYINPKLANSCKPTPHKESFAIFAQELGYESLPSWTIYLWQNVGTLAFTGYAHIYRDKKTVEREKAQELAVQRLLRLLPALDLFKSAEVKGDIRFKNIRTGEYVG